MIDGKELLRRFKAAGWPTPAQVHALLGEAAPPTRDDIERMLSVLSSKGLPGDSRDQANRLFIFRTQAEKVIDKALFLPYVRALRGGDAQLAAVLVPLLPKVNNVEGHADLCALLRDSDGGLRRATATVLKQIGGTTVFQTLSGYCGEASFQGRVEALDVLISIGRQVAIPALAATIEVGSVTEKLMALQYLGNAELMTKDIRGAIRAIGAALGHTMERVAMQAVTCFGALCSEDEYFESIGPLLDAKSLSMVRTAIEAIQRFSSPRVMAMLSRKLHAGPNAIRMAVLGAAEAIGNDQVLPLVIEGLNFKKIDVRQRAAEVLTNLALANKVDLARTILWLLRSRDVNVRRMAVDISKRVGDPTGELAPRLLRLLRDEDWWVRERVMDALVVMAGKQLTRHLVAYLQDPSDIVRRYAADALLRLKDPGSLGALVRAAQGDADWWVRERAIEAVGAIGLREGIPYILDLLAREPDLRRVCIEALQAMHADEAAPHVAALLGEADPDMKLVILGCLETLDEPGQAGAVQPLCQDPDHRVAAAARLLLGRWKVSYGHAGAKEGRAGLSLLERMLVALAEAEGDDLILSSGMRPYIKKLGKVVPLSSHVFTAEEVLATLTPSLSAKQLDDLQALRDVDFSLEVKSEGLRFRANVFYQLPGLSAVFRIIKDRIPVLEDLGLPPIVQTFAELKNGLVLIGGPTGSGKSTTLAGLIDHINRNSSRHVVTLEDPIEVIHQQKKCLINQRELGTHTISFEKALRATLRQDPDVILVGEMRDLDTIRFALTASETGHLVFGTVHTVSVDTSIDRMINVFPGGQQPQVRALLADTLRAVACQYLLRRKDGQGRVLAVEVMVNNEAIANLVRKGKTFQIPSVIATQREAGMQSMDTDLERVYKAGLVSAEEAYMKAASKKNFELVIAGPDAAKFLAEAKAAQSAGKSVEGET
ncbi:MAG: PilT/PilU family type 4a pilus ATPase [Deltaproteobacteria bacterium]|nr:PilT/PilU family type 4a pilus ATPase [Deltaproteobacteria bacterium]